MFLVEGSARELLGVRRSLGTHLVLALGDGTHALYAHVRRGSLAVRPGDRVRAGGLLARCGNPGNSCEPHLHFQLMDGPDPDTAASAALHAERHRRPPNGDAFEAPGTTASSARPSSGPARPSSNPAQPPPGPA
jgi:murein DD-endopeptidase MepM/ murein hydrolase activator NlpD